ncbi:hypothetical protein GXW82_21870 [Streptacidiphilus sp. 4-A2]|nr:hypothetical protein [Streptacidiphilus sp. 4-A2]
MLPVLLRIRRTGLALAAARVGVLQMLMGGEVVLAQRTAHAMSPGLLAAQEARVLILGAGRSTAIWSSTSARLRPGRAPSSCGARSTTPT